MRERAGEGEREVRHGTDGRGCSASGDQLPEDMDVTTLLLLLGLLQSWACRDYRGMCFMNLGVTRLRDCGMA